MADGLTLRRVRAAQALYHAGVSTFTMASLDAPAGEVPEGPTIGEVALTDPRPSPESVAVAADLRRRLAERMRRLTDAERAVVFARFCGWALEDIGVATHYSRERVRQIEELAREKILRVDEPEPAPPKPRGRPRREQSEADPRRERMVELWHALRNPSLLSSERRDLSKGARVVAREKLNEYVAEAESRITAANAARAEKAKAQPREDGGKFGTVEQSVDGSPARPDHFPVAARVLAEQSHVSPATATSCGEEGEGEGTRRGRR